ncbi:unnamed protein product [Tilletia controversa]|nr:unnamed protein product [Tilletia controversa]
MADEGVDRKIVGRWKHFNKKIEHHPESYVPYVQRDLQLLYQHQRHTFATRSRRQKAELEQLKKKKMSDKERRKRRKALKRFDPGQFPTTTFQAIKETLKDARLDAVEGGQAQPTQSGSAQSGGFRSSSLRSEPSRRSNTPGTSSAKPFHDSSSASKDANGARRACARCGTRERHKPEDCAADRLSYYPGKPTHVIRNSSGQLVERSGGRRVCVGYNATGCTWSNCPGEHVCSLCGATCTAQTCRLSRPPQSQ